MVAQTYRVMPSFQGNRNTYRGDNPVSFTPSRLVVLETSTIILKGSKLKAKIRKNELQFHMRLSLAVSQSAFSKTVTRSSVSYKFKV